MLTQWFLSLPIWIAMLWFFGGAVFYPLGINLAKSKKNMSYLALSGIAFVTTYTTMSAITNDLSEEPIVQIVQILIIFVLVILMVKWANPSKKEEKKPILETK